MKYTYSICHPDKPEIEYPKGTKTKEEVYEMASTYNWKEKLIFLESLDEKDICFSPSLVFKNSETNHSFCLTAHFNNSKLDFSLWYNRPVKKKSFFGFGKEVEKIEVIDKWSFSKEEALKHLMLFLDEKYSKLELFMTSI